jgi:DNA-binding NarL/FixJ family response regulator
MAARRHRPARPDHPGQSLPDIDRTEVTRLLPEWTRIPIIILSVRGQETDKIAALDADARGPAAGESIQCTTGIH